MKKITIIAIFITIFSFSTEKINLKSAKGIKISKNDIEHHNEHLVDNKNEIKIKKKFKEEVEIKEKVEIKEEVIQEEKKEIIKTEELKEEIKEEVIQEEKEEEITFDLKFDKYFNKDMEVFAYLKTKTNLRMDANSKSKIIKTLNSGERLAILETIKTKEDKQWYKVKYKDKIGYILASQAIKRYFNWNRAVEKANQINNFINKAKEENKKIYYVDNYVSLNTETDGKKDRYGNSANQSIRAYYNNKEYINLPDRSLFVIIDEDAKYLKVKTMSYGDDIYSIPKTFKNKLKVAKIDENINKFIYVDRHSQTQVSIEKNEKGNYNVNSVGYITTGITKGAGFVTPYGDYLVAYTKPVMAYVSDFEKEAILNSKGEKIGEKPIIIGDAKYAIRFSGGAYLHGIPSTYEPKENREQRKKATASKLGTIPLSHKCVRNEDDSVYYLYKWVNGKNKMTKNGFTYPEENVIVIVE